MPAYPLEGRGVLVTGGGRGIGAALAHELHRRGAAVAVVDVDGDAARATASGLGGRAIGLQADVADAAATAAAVDAAAERLGGLDVCVANAGVANQPATLQAIDPAAFERIVEVNVLGVWRTVRCCLPHVVPRRGQVVLVSSVYAWLNGAMLSPYAASKAAVEQLGRALRVELAPAGAGVTLAYFGPVATEMLRQGIDQDPVGRRAERLAPFPFDRRVSADEVARALAGAIERRAPRVVVPRRWLPLRWLRGLADPAMDAVAARDPRVRALVRAAGVSDRPAAGDPIAGGGTNAPAR